ncbi:MAG TPA: hypothetical protein VGK24_04625 [Candidatus Angelobacter sp.]|jgi:hypothetical protein
MPLSISSSEVSTLDRELEPSLLKTTNPPARGLERPIPMVPWWRILATIVSITFVLMVAWEIEMRHLGLRAGDLDDENGYWTVERRKVDAVPQDSVVIIGDSRILFDTDLATWQELTGRRPIQLGLIGSSARPILHDLAIDKHFAGLLVIGTAEFSYFGDDGNALPLLNYMKTESPSQRIGHQIYKTLSRHLAFLDSHYTLFTLIEQHKWPERKDVSGAYMGVWKVGEAYDDRQSYSWERLERDSYLREHARAVWMNLWPGPPLEADDVTRVIASTKSDIDQIRARGGEVIWIRPPSSGSILEIERTRYPRQKVWDRLVHETASFGVYFEDYPAMQNLSSPDWSHLSKKSAIAFTDAYVRVLREHVEWLRTHDASDTGRRLNAVSRTNPQQ